MSWARIHRWLAIVLVVLLVVWSATGLLFHLKPGWNRAYDQLTAERREGELRASELVPLASLHGAHRIELFDTALGPLYRVTAGDETTLVDARTGRTRSPLTIDDARALASDAIAHSAYRDDYGDIAGIDATEQTVQVRCAGGPIVEVGRGDARLSQRGPDTDRIDWLYRIHYLQWTGHATLDRLLAVIGLALIWAVMIPGVVLFVKRLRR